VTFADLQTGADAQRVVPAVKKGPIRGANQRSEEVLMHAVCIALYN